MSSLARRPEQAAAEPAPAVEAAAPAPAVAAPAADTAAAEETGDTPTLDAIAGGGFAAAVPDGQPDPDVSRNAVDDAPSGWASREIDSFPAEKFDKADAGHVYHLLDDGTVVSTSVPFTVDNDVADLVRQDAANKPGKNDVRTSNAAVDNNDHALPEALTFEVNLGLAAAGDGMTASQAVMDQIQAYLTAYATQLTGAVQDVEEQKRLVNEKINTTLPQLGTTDPSVAGAVGKDPTTLLTVLKGGNLREQMTILFNFMRFFSDSMLKMTETERTTIIGQAKLGKDALEKRIDDVSKKTTQVDPMMPALPNGTASGADQLQAPAEGQILQNSTDGNFVFGANARNPGLADVDQKLLDGQDRARIEDKNAGSSQRTIGSLDGTNAELSEREKAVQQKGIEKNLGGKLPEEAELEKEKLLWAEGADKWIADAQSEFVKHLQEMQVPFGAGPSGTTARLMSTAQQLGYADPVQMRLACMGYLLPIRAHSLVEILVSAAAYGAPTPLDGLMMYTEIAPYDASTLKGFSGGKFPHEWKAEREAPTTPPVVN